MISLPDTLQSLIDSFKKLPGIGAKTAERLAYYIAENTNESNYNFSKNIINVKIGFLYVMYVFLIEKENICNACNSKRDESKICVVQRPKDVIAIDKTGFPGLYHVLGGVLSHWIK